MNAVSRRAICGSIFARLFFADSAKTIVQAKASFNLFESIGPAPAFADCDQFSLCKNEIFKIIDVPEEGLASVISLRPPRGFRKAIKSFFDFSREPDGKHENLRYTSIARLGNRKPDPT